MKAMSSGGKPRLYTDLEYNEYVSCLLVYRYRRNFLSCPFKEDIPSK
jgi:hypothetical protein